MQQLNENLIKLVDLLSDYQYHDGTSIGNKLNITRAAVWKSIKKLVNANVPIGSIKGKGYILKSPFSLLDAKKINPHLKAKSINLNVFEKLDSTNNYLKSQIKSDNRISVCISEMQEKGKGRFNRKWCSPFGKNIYCSIKYIFQKDISELSGLSLAIGLSVCKAIETGCEINDQLYIKWPNDIIITNKKVAGIIIEIQAESNGDCTAIIGVGVNVNMLHANKKQISCPWSSLQILTKKYQDRNHLCALLINHLIIYMEEFKLMGMKPLLEEWKDRDYLLNKQIILSSDARKTRGTCLGINSQGNLLLMTSKGERKVFSSGDTTIL